MLVFSFTKSQPIKITVDDKTFIYVWFDLNLHKWKIGFESPLVRQFIHRENINIEDHFKEKNKYE